MTLILLFLVGGCGYKIIPTIMPTDDCMKDSTCDGVFVDNQTCNPPCWQGLEPGVTNFEETEAILKSIEFINADIVIEEFEEYQFKRRINFHSEDGKWSGWAYFDNDILYKIGFGGELSANFVTVSENIISPTSVIVMRDHRGGLLFYVIELDTGIMFTAGYGKTTLLASNRIDPETPVVGLSYFDPTKADELYLDHLLLPYFIDVNPWTDSIQPWLGYGTITDRYEVTGLK